MIRTLSCLVALATLTLFSVGCGGGSSGTVAACGLPSGLQTALVYPTANSTGNSTSLAEVAIATSGTLPSDWTSGNGWDIELNYTATGAYPGHVLGQVFASTTFGAIPTPNTTPSFSNPTYWQSTFSYAANANTPLPPGTLITVTINDLNSNCYPGVTIGTFST